MDYMHPIPILVQKSSASVTAKQLNADSLHDAASDHSVCRKLEWYPT